MSLTPAKIMEIQFRFADHLKERGVSIYFQGPMDIADRWKLIKDTIVMFNLAQLQYRKESAETFAQAYARATGEPLIPAKQENAA